jgi:hypothetical protein
MSPLLVGVSVRSRRLRSERPEPRSFFIGRGPRAARGHRWPGRIAPAEPSPFAIAMSDCTLSSSSFPRRPTSPGLAFTSTGPRSRARPAWVFQAGVPTPTAGEVTPHPGAKASLCFLKGPAEEGPYPRCPAEPACRVFALLARPQPKRAQEPGQTAPRARRGPQGLPHVRARTRTGRRCARARRSPSSPVRSRRAQGKTSGGRPLFSPRRGPPSAPSPRAGSGDPPLPRSSRELQNLEPPPPHLGVAREELGQDPLEVTWRFAPRSY